MSDLPDFAVILPLAFLVTGAIILLGGLSYARPARFDERSLRRWRRWRRKLAMVSFIPFSTSRSDAEIEELTRVWRRQQRYFLTGAGVGLVIVTLVMLVGVFVAPDQALIGDLFGSAYGVAVVGSLCFFAATTGAFIGYTLHFRHYPFIAAPPSEGSEIDVGSRDLHTFPAWRRITTYRPWYVALTPSGILALYTAFIIVGAARLAQAQATTYNFGIDALAERFVATHIWLLALPIAFAALMQIVVGRGVRAFVHSPERRFVADAQVSRRINLALRAQLVRTSLATAMLFDLELSILTGFFILVFPFSLPGIVGIALLMLSFLLCMSLPQQVVFPKVALTEAA